MVVYIHVEYLRYIDDFDISFIVVVSLDDDNSLGNEVYFRYYVIRVIWFSSKMSFPHTCSLSCQEKKYQIMIPLDEREVFNFFLYYKHHI